MPQDGTTLPADAGLGGGGLLGDVGVGGGYMLPIMGFGSPGQMMGSSGIMDPAWMGALQRQRYAMGLMGAGTQISPVISPWQALTRAIQGPLGAWEERRTEQQMAEVQQRMQAASAEGWQQARDIINRLSLGGGAAAGQPQTTPVRAPGTGVEPSAAEADLLTLPDVQALPASIRPLLAEKMAAAGLGLQDAAQYARMIRQESGGVNIDPKTGRVITSSAGSIGPAQMQPATFAEMQKKYNIAGDITDPAANLEAGARYYKDGLTATNGDRYGAAVWYNAGPRGLQHYLAGQEDQLPQETRNYVRQVSAGDPAGMTTMATTAEPIAGGPVPGSGFQAALQLRLIGAQMMQNVTNPYAVAQGRALMAIAPTLAQVGQLGPPQYQGQTGLYTQTDPVTGRVITAGQQLGAEANRALDLQKLQTLGPKGFDAMTPAERQQYTFAWTRQAVPHYEVDPATRQMTLYQPVGLPANLPVPPGMTPPAGVTTRAAAPGAAEPPGAPQRMGPSGTAIEMVNQDSKKAFDEAYAQQDQAYSDATRNTLTATQNVRNFITQTKPGRLQELIRPVGEWLAAVGIPSSTIQQFTGQDPSAGQTASKQLFDMLAERIQQQGGVRAAALWQQFERALPSMESTPQTIQNITRLYDAFVQRERDYADARVGLATEMRNRFVRTNDVSAWDEGRMARFQREWSQQPQNDPRVYSAAAMIGARQPPSLWGGGLTAAQRDAAERLAAKMYPSEIQYTPPTTAQGAGG